MIRRLMFCGASEALCRCRASLSTFHAQPTRAEGNDNAWESVYKQEVPRTMEEMGSLLGKKVVSPPKPFLLKVAIIGVPNSGKSTLINKLMGWRVCSASSKVHTTQLNARAVYNAGSTQVVFLDTPGIVTPQEVSKHHLQRTLLTGAEMSLQEADLLAVVHDVSCHYTHSTLHTPLLRLLALHPTIPAVLVLNKVDLMKTKSNLLKITRVLTEGIVGNRRFFFERKKRSDINKDKLIKRALLQDDLAASKRCDAAPQREAASQRCTQDDENTNSFKSQGTGTDTKNMDVEQGKDSLLSFSYDISHIKERDILAGRVHLTEQQVKTFVQNRKSWPLFEEVFMVSAKNGTGVDDLMDFLLASAQPQPWLFGPQVVTDQNPEEIALMAVREKFLDHFKQEIPYTLKFSIEYWDLTESDLLSIVVKVQCSRKGLIRVLLGSQGDTVAQLAREAEQALRNTFRTEVKLRLNVVYERHLKKKMASK